MTCWVLVPQPGIEPIPPGEEAPVESLTIGPAWNSPQFLIISAISSVQFSRSVVSDSLQPHELQHARPPCPSPTPGVHPDSCPSSR